MRNFVTGNIPDFPEYYITKNGKLYSKWSGVWKLKSLSRIKNNGYVIQTLHNKAGLKKTFWYTSISCFGLYTQSR